MCHCHKLGVDCKDVEDIIQVQIILNRTELLRILPENACPAGCSVNNQIRSDQSLSRVQLFATP